MRGLSLNTVIFTKTKIAKLRKQHQQYFMFSAKSYNLVIIPKIQKISLHVQRFFLWQGSIESSNSLSRKAKKRESLIAKALQKDSTNMRAHIKSSSIGTSRSIKDILKSEGRYVITDEKTSSLPSTSSKCSLQTQFLL